MVIKEKGRLRSENDLVSDLSLLHPFTNDHLGLLVWLSARAFILQLQTELPW